MKAFTRSTLGAVITGLTISLLVTTPSAGAEPEIPSGFTTGPTSFIERTGSGPLDDYLYIDVDSDGRTVQELKDFLKDPERERKLASLLADAGPIVAVALNDGVFGETRRYDPFKNPLPDDYVGFGGIETIPSDDNLALGGRPAVKAWVYWNADGSIDTSRPIEMVRISNRDGTQAAGLMSAASSYEDVYTVELIIEGRRLTNMSAYTWIGEKGWSYAKRQGLPDSYRVYQIIDIFSTVNFAHFMSEWFEEDWRE